MPTLDDMELLQQYATSCSEEAFATLVSRHINLVYSAALRQVGNPHQAEEIAQAVFLVLVRKCHRLRPGVILSGWLYNTARLTSANFLRGESRRQRREQEAYMQSSLNDPEPSWSQIAPLLDVAMARLSEKDRNAVVLRYFENKDMQNIAGALGSSEDAAKMRISRALGKLREFFVRRGVSISGAGLASVISDFSVQAAPTGLAASVTSGICGGSVLTASTLTLAKGTLSMMAWTKINIGIATVAVAAVAYQWHEVSVAKKKSAELQQQLERQTQLSNEQQNSVKQLQERNASLAQTVVAIGRQTAALRAGTKNAPAAKPSIAGNINDQAAGGGMKGGALAKMFSDPAMKQAMRDQQEWMLKKQYAALIKQLNLTPEDTNKFYSILLDALLSNVDKSLAMFSGNKEAAAQGAKAVQDAQAATNTQLLALLGDNGFAQYKDYSKSVTDRMLLDQMKPDFAENPLMPEQEQKLIEIMHTERENALRGQPDTQTDPTDLASTIDLAMKRQEQCNEQVLQQASAFLTPQQVQILGASQSNLLVLQRASMSVAQRMFGGGTNGER